MTRGGGQSRASPLLRRSIALRAGVRRHLPHDLLFLAALAYILAQSWDWLHGETGYVNLGHYIFFGIGAYAFCLPLIGGCRCSCASSLRRWFRRCSPPC